MFDSNSFYRFSRVVVVASACFFGWNSCVNAVSNFYDHHNKVRNQRLIKGFNRDLSKSLVPIYHHLDSFTIRQSDNNFFVESMGLFSGIRSDDASVLEKFFGEE